MGKALVINGLVVKKPLMTINISSSQEDAVLKEYFAANVSITQNEKTALSALVKGLIDAELWSKVKYLYPFVGDKVSDATLDVISPSTEDLFKNAPTTGLSVINRNLVANNRQQEHANTSIRAKSLVPTSIGFVMAGEPTAETTAGGQGFMLSSSSNLGLTIATYASPYRYAELECGDTKVFVEENTQSYIDRIVFGNVNNGVASLYYDTELKKQSSVNLSTYNINQSFGVMWNYRAQDYKYKFFAITEGMTSQDWSVFYPLLLTFLKSVGKHD